MDFFSEDKQGVRKEAQNRRAALLEHEREKYAHDSSQLPLQVSAYLNEKKPRIIAAYTSFRNEIDPLPSIAFWLRQHPDTNAILSLPRVVGDDLHFYRVRERFFIDTRCQSDFCTIGFAGILEPKTSLERIDIQDIDCFLIPGLAFDRQGYRLGYGRGFYDRTLELSAERALKVGISYDELVVTSLPHQPHDIRMDTILTPRMRYDFELNQ